MRQSEVDIFNIRQWIVGFIFGQVVSVTARQLRITNLAVSRYAIKRENSSLPIDMRHSKTPLLKLPMACLNQRPPPHSLIPPYCLLLFLSSQEIFEIGFTQARFGKNIYLTLYVS